MRDGCSWALHRRVRQGQRTAQTPWRGALRRASSARGRTTAGARAPRTRPGWLRDTTHAVSRLRGTGKLRQCSVPPRRFAEATESRSRDTTVVLVQSAPLFDAPTQAPASALTKSCVEQFASRTVSTCANHGAGGVAARQREKPAARKRPPQTTPVCLEHSYIHTTWSAKRVLGREDTRIHTPS